MTERNHLLEELDIHGRYLDRLRAERLTKVMWQLTQGHISWKVVSTSAPLEARGAGGGEGGTSGGVSFAGATPRYLEFLVPPVAMLEFEAERWLIWGERYVEAMHGLTLPQRECWKEHVLRNRYSAVFAVNHRCQTVRRSVSATQELAEAAHTILGICEKQRARD